MRIALYHNLPSGGAKRALLEITRRLAERHEILVFTLSSADHAFSDIRPFVAEHRVYEFAPRPLYGSPFGRLNQAVRLDDLQRVGRLTAQIANDLERVGADVLFVHPCQFEKSPSLTTYARQMPSVYYCQEPLRRLYEAEPKRPYDDSASARRTFLNKIDPLLYRYNAYLKKLDRRNAQNADVVLVNSGFMQTAVNHIYQVQSQVSYLGVDVAWFRPLSLPKQPMLLSVGSLTPLKGFDFLIQALAAMPPAERLPLTIASNFQNPPEKAYLEQLADSLGVTLHLVGNVTDERLVELYNEATLTLYAPVREPFGLVALESMACGTPVVAVREGGTQETVRHEETGLLVERDAAQFAAAVRRLLGDAALRAAYGRCGRDHAVQNWNWDKAAATVEGYLETAVAASA